ncbi:MAG: DUF1015 domain-containing protein [Planctomycetota bacterium]
MPELKPLTPVRFAAPAGGGDISSKIAPPYDVLDAGPKAELLARDPHNIVAVDLPVTPPKTVGPDAAYEATGELYRGWLGEGVLVHDDRRGVVVYEQAYELDGQGVRRRGLITGLGVEEFNRPGGGIFRHEMTIAGGIGDRTKLMQATRAQLSPIFGIFPDPEKSVVAALNEVCESREPDFFGTTDHDGVAHRCWAVADADTLATLAEFFADTDVFIADGHHRYTTALQFSKDHPELPGAGACLFVLVAAEDPGMVVLPTHRVVCGLDALSADDLRAMIEHDPRLKPAASAESARFGVYLPGHDSLIGIDTTDDPLAELYPDKPAVWRTLDVAVLQHLLVDELWRGGGGPLSVKYTADVGEMKEMTDAEPGRVGVVMRSTPLESVMGVSRANEVMPPKSTYFYPKLATGLVINPLD